MENILRVFAVYLHDNVIFGGLKSQTFENGLQSANFLNSFKQQKREFVKTVMSCAYICDTGPQNQSYVAGVYL